MTGSLGAADSVTGAVPAITWLEVSTEDLGRWSWRHKLSWPRPLTSSNVGLWEPPLDELFGDSGSAPYRPRSEERLLETLGEVLASPDYCAYVIRSAGDKEADAENASECYYVALVRDDEAVVVVDEPRTVRLGRVHPTSIAAAITAQVPKLQAAPVTRVALAKQTVELIAAGFAREGTPERTLRSAMASAGIPDATATRLFAIAEGPLAVGIVGAVGYTTDGAQESPRCASWTELSDGGMISVQTRGGDVVWEPLTAAAIGRCVVDALQGLSSREGTP